MPQPAVALACDDSALEIGGRSGRDVPRIDVKPLQQGLAGPGQLLHGVHDHRVVDPQVLQQGLVGELVDPRLVAAQIDRHAIRDFMVQRPAPAGERSIISRDMTADSLSQREEHEFSEMPNDSKEALCPAWIVSIYADLTFRIKFFRHIPRSDATRLRRYLTKHWRLVK